MAAQNITQITATGTYADASTSIIATQATWAVSDTSIATIGAVTGLVTIQNAGKVWGGDIGVTATLAPGTPGTGTLIIISSDSGSVAPRMPQQDNHWQALGLSPWGAWFGCQELTGNLVGSGSRGYSLTASAGGGIGVQYGQTAGSGEWTRNAISISGSTGMRIVAPSGTGPNASLSLGLLGYVSAAPGAVFQGTFGIVHTTSANRRYFGSTATSHNGVIAANAANTVFPMVVTARMTDRIHPMLIIHDSTNFQTVWASDIAVYISGGANDTITNDGDKGLGNITGAAAPSASMVWMASVTGSVAESYASLSGAADLLSRLGWNVTWKDCPSDSSSIKLPFLPSHWAQLGQQPWTATWNMQEYASPLSTIDKWTGISQSAFQLAAGGSVTFENAVSNWARKAVVLTETNGQRFSATVSQQMLIDPTGSYAMILYAQPSTPAGVARSLGGIGNNATAGHPGQFAAGISTTGLTTLYCAGATATGSQSIVTDGNFHAVLMVYDKTNSRAKLYTDLEKVTGSFNALNLVANLTSSISIGGTESTTPCPSKYIWAAICTGTLAESFSDDGKASAFLKSLGWNITW